MTDLEPEQLNTPTPDPTPDPVPAAEPQKTEPTGDGGAPSEPMIPKSRLDEVIAERNALKAGQEKLQQEQEAATKKAAEEQGEYKKLYEAAEAKSTEAEAKVLQMAHDALRKQIATEAGYPTLWSRIDGEDEAAIKEDMKTLLEALPKPSAPGLDGGAGTGIRKSGKPAPTEQEIREQAAVLGVNADMLAQQYGVALGKTN